MTDPATALATEIAKPLVAKLIDALMRPALEVARAVSDPIADLLTNRFAEYLTRQYAKHCHLPTIVFAVRRPLEDLYVPLTVIEESQIFSQLQFLDLDSDKGKPNTTQAGPQTSGNITTGRQRNQLTHFGMLQFGDNENVLSFKLDHYPKEFCPR